MDELGLSSEKGKEKVKKAVYDYITEHEGEIYVDKCAKDLEFSEAEVELALDSLQSEGKIERESPEKIEIRKEETETMKPAIAGIVIGIIITILIGILILLW